MSTTRHVDRRCLPADRCPLRHDPRGLGGAFAATIAEVLLTTFGSSWTIGVYIVVLCLISGGAVSLVKSPQDGDLHVDNTHAR